MSCDDATLTTTFGRQTSPSSLNSEHIIEGEIRYCGYCPFDIYVTCDEQLEKIMNGKPGLDVMKAQKSLLPTCGLEGGEPYVLLHVGPHKTGTTSIQNFIFESIYYNKTFFEEDNFAIPQYQDMPGRFDKEGTWLNFAHCMLHNYNKDGGRMHQQACNGVRAVLPSFMQKSYNAKRNVLIVAEDLDRKTIDHQRLQYYLRPYKRIKVIASYRRLHEWLFSFYNQIVQLYLKRYIRNETDYPSFVQWVESQYSNFLQVHTFAVAERYRNSGRIESVEVINMHDTADILETLFCDFLETPVSCKAIQNRTKVRNMNKGRLHDYDRLCTEAMLSGKIQNFHLAISKRVAKKLEADITKHNIFGSEGYPKKCLNQTFLDQLIKTEMEQEEAYFPEWYRKNGGLEMIRSSFEKANSTFCSMDVDKILDSGVLDKILKGY
ncbi:hypothetical protein HJC23_013912 [Cyclotella cryptica]|uniref:Sulfotransferase domain-containing protein n=1 Tax=Cyclotella cryptica TaxID=29204 RepID=A0ABD3QHB9_9STRA